MRTYTPAYTPATVIAERNWGAGQGTIFTLYGPDPYDQLLYSLPIPFDQRRQYDLAVTYSADAPVTAGFKLLLWYAKTPAATMPGGANRFVSTVTTADLAITPATFAVRHIVNYAYTWIRVVCEVDTCTANVPGVTATISGVSMIDRGTKPGY